ncbi:uncharacterized protein LY89DRAFT_779523 [Mollisia scopiformis]|uniref:Uncharacterized protein n=1 Tax=Mollisia scopiformis TaxID=149040 RepID=A0A194XL18_MOLSC|nr:uncharacterized protein LY89DRAFT_779523 [Mollisia scopiformis]KUJ20826.1 hypothetical protein LY89DRAFT_779523 [Mollisia scopiformis]
MILSPLVQWLLVAGASAIPHAENKRAATSDVTIYAYGSTIAGRPILADSSGNAYVSNAEVQPANLSSITWSISPKGTADWTVTLNSTNSTTTTSGVFYIIPSDDSYEPVGFVINGTTPSGTVTSGFLTYGSVVQYKADSVLTSEFWAEEIEGTDQYLIKWNADGSHKDGAIPVTLQTTGPS